MELFCILTKNGEVPAGENRPRVKHFRLHFMCGSEPQFKVLHEAYYPHHRRPL